jgi:hypothetical protein
VKPGTSGTPARLERTFGTPAPLDGTPGMLGSPAPLGTLGKLEPAPGTLGRPAPDATLDDAAGTDTESNVEEMPVACGDRPGPERSEG